MPEISLKPEGVFYIGSVHITNTLLSLFIIFSLLSIFLIIAANKFRVNKPSNFQLIVETIVNMLGTIFTDIMGVTHKASLLFSFVLSFFVLILFSNWFGLLPFVGPLGVNPGVTNEIKLTTEPETATEHATIIEPATETAHEPALESEPAHAPTFGSCLKERNCILTGDLKIVKSEHFIPVFRAPTSDLSFTLVLALLSVLVTNAIGFASLGFGYIKKYFNVSNGIDFAVGILELISELGKIISFSFRLFGNVFAGEVLLVVIGFISYGVASLPFMGLEFFLGVIQALVFFMLTTVFVSLAKSQHH